MKRRDAEYSALCIIDHGQKREVRKDSIMKKTIWLSALLCLFILIAACSPRYGGTPEFSDPDKATPAADGTTTGATVSYYYDFADILIPQEMKLDPDSSLLFETTNLKAGRIRFKGWVDPVSLFDFFMKNMPQDNWRLRSYFKYGVYLLVFEKPDRDCIISIHKGTFNSWLEVWVTPRLVHAGPE